MTLFEELAAFDRPWATVKFKLGNKEYSAEARLPNAMEQDALDAFYMDEYARLLVSKTKPVDGKQSELEALRAVTGLRSKKELIDQLLMTRVQDLNRLALEYAGIDYGQEQAAMADMTDEERKAHVAKRESELQDGFKMAREEFTAEYEAQDVSELVTKVSELTVNMKCIGQAKRLMHAHFVFYALYDGPDRVFKSVEAVRETLTGDTIEQIVEAIHEALKPQSDLPFVSPDDSEPSKPLPSSDISGEATLIGGQPTETTPEDSK